MGLINKFFKSARDIAKDEIDAVPWTDIDSSASLDAIWKASNKRPQLIFKHSTSCGISRMAMKQFEQVYRNHSATLDVHYLDLLSHRDLSREIATRSNITHESPQVIVLDSGNVVYSDSHHGIDLERILNQLGQG